MVRWNQTGQKFAGASDITQELLRPYPIYLWMLVIITYLTLLYRIGNHMFAALKSGSAMATACALVLVVPALFFKLGFTANDAPELLDWLGNDGLRFLERIPLVGSARVIFLMLASESLWAFSAAANAENPKAARRRECSQTNHFLNPRSGLMLRPRTTATASPSPNTLPHHPVPHHKHSPLPALHSPTLPPFFPPPLSPPDHNNIPHPRPSIFLRPWKQ